LGTRKIKLKSILDYCTIGTDTIVITQLISTEHDAIQYNHMVRDALERNE